MKTLHRAVVLSVVLPAAVALACDCKTASATPAQALERSDAVFEATRTEKAPKELPEHRVRYELKVAKAWKGVKAGDVVTLETDTSSCGYRLTATEPFIIGATRLADGALAAKQCDARVMFISRAGLAEARKQLEGAPATASPPGQPAPAKKP